MIYEIIYEMIYGKILLKVDLINEFNKYFLGGIYIIKLYIFKHSLSVKLTQNIFVFFFK